MTALPTTPSTASARIAIVGAGPAGLMAAETLANAGLGAHTHVFDAMPSVGRKFLLAGRGGLNLTHAEPIEPFVSRYNERASQVSHWLTVFSPTDVRAWAKGLGIDTFVGSSQRVFPTDMKAAPLLRAWLARLRASGVTFHARHRWQGFNDQGQSVFDSATGLVVVAPQATVLALGGASWQRLGSDGAWVPWLQGKGVDVAPLQPANCGFDVATPWSEHLRSKFAGEPLKTVALHHIGAQGQRFDRGGEMVLTATGLEGSLVYACAHLLRADIAQCGSATINLDLLPAKTLEQVRAEVAHPRGSRSLSAHLKSRLNVQGVKAALLHELLSKAQLANPLQLAQAIKSLPIKLGSTRPIDEAISSAGGVRLEAMSEQLQLKAMPGVFCAGEMLDWEAPTGGYLLNATMGSGKVAALGVLAALAT